MLALGQSPRCHPLGSQNFANFRALKRYCVKVEDGLKHEGAFDKIDCAGMMSTCAAKKTSRRVILSDAF